MGLSWSYDPSRKFDMLTWVASLGSFVINLFFNFIFQHLVDWKLSFIIYFDLFSTELL
jgi:hypothetical protein